MKGTSFRKCIFNAKTPWKKFDVGTWVKKINRVMYLAKFNLFSIQKTHKISRMERKKGWLVHYFQQCRFVMQGYWIRYPSYWTLQVFLAVLKIFFFYSVGGGVGVADFSKNIKMNLFFLFFFIPSSFTTRYTYVRRCGWWSEREEKGRKRKKKMYCIRKLCTEASKQWFLAVKSKK